MILADNSSVNHFAKGKLLLAVSLFLFLAACSRPSLQQLQGSTMGTTWHASYLAGETTPSSELVQQQLQQRLDELEQVFSTYRDDSELSRLNRAAVGESIKVSKDMAAVIQASQQVWRKSGGAFDPSVGALVNLWGFGPTWKPEPEIPAVEQLQQARASQGFDRLALDYSALKVKIKQDIMIDFSSIAKGYAADQLALLFEQLGVQNYLVEVGGELKLKGYKAKNIPWKIAIEKPQLARGQVQKALMLTDLAVATSGDYRNYFELDGRKYSHTINPVSGYPVEHNVVSVTVLHQSATLADAWATAMVVMGEEKSLALAEEMGFAVLLMVRDNEQHGQNAEAQAEQYREVSSSAFRKIEAQQNKLH